MQEKVVVISVHCHTLNKCHSLVLALQRKSTTRCHYQSLLAMDTLKVGSEYTELDWIIVFVL